MYIYYIQIYIYIYIYIQICLPVTNASDCFVARAILLVSTDPICEKQTM